MSAPEWKWVSVRSKDTGRLNPGATVIVRRQLSAHHLADFEDRIESVTYHLESGNTAHVARGGMGAGIHAVQVPIPFEVAPSTVGCTVPAMDDGYPIPPIVRVILSESTGGLRAYKATDAQAVMNARLRKLECITVEVVYVEA